MPVSVLAAEAPALLAVILERGVALLAVEPLFADFPECGPVALAYGQSPEAAAQAADKLRATIEALPEVVAAVNNRIPVFLDGGVRRGTDVFKALALGAKGVGIGRPMLWGLGAFGEAGVNRALEIMQAELKLVMGNCGTRTIADINRAYVATPNWKI